MGVDCWQMLFPPRSSKLFFTVFFFIGKIFVDEISRRNVLSISSCLKHIFEIFGFCRVFFKNFNHKNMFAWNVNDKCFEHSFTYKTYLCYIFSTKYKYLSFLKTFIVKICLHGMLMKKKCFGYSFTYKTYLCYIFSI